MLEAKINLTMVCDECLYSDPCEYYFQIIKTKDDFKEPYDDFLKIAKEEGWYYSEGRCLCPSCRKKGTE